MAKDEILCTHPSWDLVRDRRVNGSSVYWRQCRLCARNVDGGGKWMPHVEAERLAHQAGLELDELPIIDDRVFLVPPCVVCGTRGTELHHWAPKEFFGDECYLWPTASLCPSCHARWHNTMRAAQRTTLDLVFAEDDPGRPF